MKVHTQDGREVTAKHWSRERMSGIVFRVTLTDGSEVLARKVVAVQRPLSFCDLIVDDLITSSFVEIDLNSLERIRNV